MAARSDIGLQRSKNEDSCLVLEDSGLCAVADGMGGHLGGEVASSMIIEVIHKEFEGFSPESMTLKKLRSRFVQCIKDANKAIYKRGQKDASLRNMGTTISALIFHADRVLLTSVGDSRIYLCRNGTISQISEDHSWVGELRKKDLISDEEARHHPLKNIITRALGMEASVEVDSFVLDTEPDDIYLLCTDGLTDLLDDQEILEIIENKKNKELSKACQTLIDRANKLGGVDNITVGLCRAFVT